MAAQSFLYSQSGVNPVPFLLAYPSVFWIVWLEGTGPGLLATAITGTAVWYFYVAPYKSFSISDPTSILGIVIFFMMGLAISILMPIAQKRRFSIILAPTERELRESERLYRTLFETMAQGVVYLSSDGSVISANPAAQEILGLSLDQLQGRTSADPRWKAIREDGSEFPANERPSMLALQTGKPVHNVNMGVLHPGENAHRWILINAVPEFLPGQTTPYQVSTTFTDVTDRKRAMEELERARNTLTEAQKIAHLGSFEYIAATQTTIWSEEEYRIYGLPPAEPSPTYDVMLKECIHPDDATLLHNTFTRAMQSKSAYELEHRIVRPDGSVRWVDDRAQPYFDEQGELLRYIGTSLDITERKRAEETLKKAYAGVEAKVVERTGELKLATEQLRAELAERKRSEFEKEQFFRFFQTSGDLMVIADPNGAFEKTNPACSELLGYSESELIAKPFVDFIHPDDKQSTLDEMASQIIWGSSLNFENRYRCKNGSFRWLSWRATYVKAEGATYATARDITASKQAEEALKNSEKEFRLLAEAMPQIVWITRADGWNIFFNQHWVDYTGQTLEESYGHGWNKPFHPDDRQRAWDAWQDATKNGAIYSLECRLRRADGAYKWWLIRGEPVKDAQGTILKWFGTCTDIDNLKEAEIALTKNQEALAIAKEAAESANRSKDLFLATLSHELRSPLTAILSWSQLIERGTLPPEKVKTGVRTIKESALSQQQLISDLLDVSRIVTGKLIFDRQPASVLEVLLAAVETVRPSAEQKSIVIEETIETPDLYITADPVRLKQALWNILSNSVKFTPNGGKIRVSLVGVEDSQGTKARITIQDNGKGIKAEFLPHLFGRFSQADSTSIRVHGGMGLGLSLVKSLVELQGGTVTASSSGEGQGATVTVTFPLLTESQKQGRATMPNPAHASSAESLDLAGLKILLIEDDERTRTTVDQVLVSLGATVKAASSA